MFEHLDARRWRESDRQTDRQTESKKERGKGEGEGGRGRVREGGREACQISTKVSFEYHRAVCRALLACMHA